MSSLIHNYENFKGHKRLEKLGWERLNSELVYTKNQALITFYDNYEGLNFYIISGRVLVDEKLAKTLYEYLKELNKFGKHSRKTKER